MEPSRAGNAGALSTPLEVSTSGAPVRAIASATFVGFSPPASPHGKAPRYPASSDQSNANPMPPGSAPFWGGLGVEQDQVRRPGIGCGACDIAGAGDGQRLPHRLAKPRAQLGHAFGRFRTVQLQRVQLGCHQCVGDDSIIRIDEQTDHGDLASCARCQSARDIRRNRTGRRWIEHQPGIVRPRRDGRIERLGVLIPQILIFAGMRSVGVLDQPHQRAVGIDQVADPQAARLQLRSFEARASRCFFPRLPPRSPMPPWHRDHPTAGNSRTSS